MDHLLLACGCGLDPATEAMAAQAGIALVLAAPVAFRDRIEPTIRRLCGRERVADPPSGDEDVEEPD